MSMIGKSLVHYEISAQLGRGGMGEVYQAKDTKLGRDVAIKVLPEEFARDTDRVARFQREAKLLASLNHPNIAAIHGLEESEGTHFLVMELIEGETLKDRIKSGPIPVEEALKLALQMAEALEAAHEKGVIHRDLKPANVKVTPDGKVKVLDFGLAKAYAGDQENLSPLDSPTISAAATQKGVILGTAAYMSPEQARGKPVDRRADIWAFGVVLFEMLTGKVTFSGDDVTDTLAAVIRSEPEWKILPANLHWRLREVLERCLEKKAKDRYGSIGDARVDIQKVLADPSGVIVLKTVAASPRTNIQRMLPWLAAALVLGAIITVIVSWILWPTLPQPRITRFAVELAGSLNPADTVALSPDGTRMVYAANNQLYVHSLDQMEPTVIPGSEQSGQPFFSPDGESIAFFTSNQLKTVILTGVAPIVLTEVGDGSSPGLVGTWDFLDRIFFGQSGPFGLSQVSANGGAPEPFAELGDHSDLDYPDVLPGGEWVLFTDLVESGNWSNAQIVAQSVATGERKVVLEGGHYARYAPTGHLVYAQNGNLFAVRFDADKVRVTGSPVPVIQGVVTNEGSGHAQFALADNGTLIYAHGTAMARQILTWKDLDGNQEPINVPYNTYNEPRLSPDGTRVALQVISNEGNFDIWIWDIVRKTMTRLTFDDAIDGSPTWTPDGKRVAFATNRTGVFKTYWKAADGTGEAEPLSSESDKGILPASFSDNGDTLVLMSWGTGLDIGMLSMEDNHEWKPLIQEKYAETQPRISTDGRWLAYMSNESGRFEIYVRPFPEVSKGKWQVSTNGGTEPKWSRDGQKLFYRSDNSIMGVGVRTQPAFSLETPEVLFREVHDHSGRDIASSWDISADGKRVLTVIEAPGDTSKEGASRPKINVVLNWFEELKQRVPVD